MSVPPLPEDVFVCRWRDRIHLVKTPEQAVRFVDYMRGIESKLEIMLRPGFGDLCAPQKGRR